MNPIEHIRKAVFCLTQREFAEAIGVAQPTVSRWEKGVPIASSEMASIRREAFTRGIEWDDKWFFEVPLSLPSGSPSVAGLQPLPKSGLDKRRRHVTVSEARLPTAGRA